MIHLTIGLSIAQMLLCELSTSSCAIFGEFRRRLEPRAAVFILMMVTRSRYGLINCGKRTGSWGSKANQTRSRFSYR
ncbi:hypothetical protein C8J56DRAFT_934738 [Mycena floridula]|nr:hypothetical protein C8J56DRAFT_934738 [Mycena floridula]